MQKLFILLFLCGASLALFAQEELTPPLAQKVPSKLAIHGDTLTDNYFWMRDKFSAEVINHLYAENTYADNVMKESTFLQKVIYEEMRSRYNENYVSVPRRNKGYYYYSRIAKGQEYNVFCRKKDSLGAPEQVVLDVNKLAEDNPLVIIGGYNISPDQKYLYYGIDNKGNRINTFYLKDIDADSLYKTEILYNVLDLIWAENNRTVYYTIPEDKTLRAWRVYKHVIGTPVSSDELILEEQDKTMQISMSKSSSKAYIFFEISRTKSSEAWYMPSDGTSKPQLFAPRKQDVLYSLNHTEADEFYILTNLNAINYRLCVTYISKPEPQNWKDVVAHNNKSILQGYVFTKDFLITSEREDAQNRVKIINRKTKEVVLPDCGLDLYDVGFSIEDYDYNKSSEVQLVITNPVTPTETWNYNLYTAEKRKLYIDTLACSYNKNNYEAKRLYVPARDGKLVPLTLTYKKGITQNGNNPLYLYSYGSYGAPNGIGFRADMLSLLDRGFICATAHIRGSNDQGYEWYENGKMFNKKNTFYDFIDCAEYLIKENYTNPKKLAIEGASAGGLLMGAVANMRPDLFQCVLAGVPFVDVINTMLDETLPLTTFEFEEWGNPKRKDCYEYMKSYSPYDNVERKNYPNILVTAGYNDSQVGYWEPAKWVAKLREFKTDTNLLLFKTVMEGGHSGATGRTAGYKEYAFKTAFMMRCLGVEENYLTIRGKVLDENKTSIPFVYVVVEGTTNGTTTNAEGEFGITVKKSNDITLSFQTLGFIGKKQKIDLTTDVSNLQIVLKSENIQLKEVLIKANAKDPAYAIMKQAIRKRGENKEKVQSFSADIYMKNNVQLISLPKKIPFFLKKDIPDTNNLGLVSLSESVARYYFARPDKKKEEMIASKVAGQRAGFSWNRVEDVFVNFYEGSVPLPYYSERPFVSPLAGAALLSYKFKYLGTFYVENKPIHKIKVIPRRSGDPLFQGEIYINEGDNYQIYTCDLFLTKDAQIEFVDTLHIKQETVLVEDSIWIPRTLQIYSRIKFFGIDASDVSTAVISNYKLNSKFPKKFFGNEVFRIEKEATKKDTSFWKTTRPAILSEAEQKFYRKGDSLIKKSDSREYKDSVAKSWNKFRFGLEGFSKRNAAKGTYFSTNPLLNMVSYNTVEGTRFRLETKFGKYNDSTGAYHDVSAYLRYGLDNNKLTGGLTYYKTLNPGRRSSMWISAGRHLKQFNSYEPIGEFMNAGYTLLNKNNFIKLYQKDAVELRYRQEISNGLYMNAGAQYMQREALYNNSFYYWVENGSRRFRPNNPLITTSFTDTLPFQKDDALQLQIAFKVIPFAKFANYGRFKIVEDTKWPEFSFAYRKGVSLTRKTFNYDYVEAAVGKDIDLKIFGLFKFDVVGGLFLNSMGMNFADYKHFAGNQTIFLMNRPSTDGPRNSTREQITEFHALPYYSFSTNERYAELHLSHNFRGFFIGKIPLLKKTKFYEIAGINALFTPARSYTEAYIGLDKIFNFLRFDVGTSLNSSDKMRLFYRAGFRLSL